MTKIEQKALCILIFLFCLGYAQQNFFLVNREPVPLASISVDSLEVKKQSEDKNEVENGEEKRIKSVESKEKKSKDKANPKKKLVSQKMELVSINHCSLKELEKLKGIGPKLAKRMLNFRNKQPNGIRNSSDLLKIKGIGPSKLKSLLPQVTFD